MFFNHAIIGLDRVMITAGLYVKFTVELSPEGHPQARNIELNDEREKGLLNKSKLKRQSLHKLDPEKVFIGNVKTFNKQLGYGFIKCDNEVFE